MGPLRLWRTTCVTQSTCLWGRGQASCPVPMTACWETGAHGATAAWWGSGQIKNTNIRLLWYLWPARNISSEIYKELVLQTWINVFFIAECRRNIHSKHKTLHFHLWKYWFILIKVIWAAFSPGPKCSMWKVISYWGQRGTLLTSDLLRSTWTSQDSRDSKDLIFIFI